MTENEQKQQLSIAYVHTVASRAGYTCQATLVDDDSVDVTIGAKGKIHQKAVWLSPRLEVQLKSTAQNCLKEEDLVYSLPMKNYNELRGPTMIPRILIVLLLPTDPGKWLEHSEDCLVSRHCAYWMSLQDKAATRNSAEITLHLPRKNLFNLEGLRGLMERAARKEQL